MFSDFHGPSFANNLYQVAAQAGRYDASLGDRSPWDVPQAGNGYWGCDDPTWTKVKMIDPRNAKSTAWPCFDFRGLPNVLSEYGVSWAMCTDPTKKQNIHNVMDALTPIRNDPVMWSNVRDLSEFLPAVQAGTLPAVSWLNSPVNDHPPNSICKGENDAVTYINAIMNSPLWSSTAIVIQYDEWGGFYDHVPPPQINNLSYGFRVPLMVISPWTKYGTRPDGGYISHRFYTNASFVRFVEDNWQLPGLGAADASANGYGDFFDYSQTPKPPLVLTLRSCPKSDRPWIAEGD